MGEWGGRSCCQHCSGVRSPSCRALLRQQLQSTHSLRGQVLRGWQQNATAAAAVASCMRPAQIGLLGQHHPATLLAQGSQGWIPVGVLLRACFCVLGAEVQRLGLWSKWSWRSADDAQEWSLISASVGVTYLKVHCKPGFDDVTDLSDACSGTVCEHYNKCGASVLVAT